MTESFEKKIADESQDLMDAEGFELSDNTLDAIAGGAPFAAASGNSGWDTYLMLGRKVC